MAKRPSVQKTEFAVPPKKKKKKKVMGLER